MTRRTLPPCPAGNGNRRPDADGPVATRHAGIDAHPVAAIDGRRFQPAMPTDDPRSAFDRARQAAAGLARAHARLREPAIGARP